MLSSHSWSSFRLLAVKSNFLNKHIELVHLYL